MSERRQGIGALLTSGMARAEVHGFYEALGFDKHAKQAFVITAR